MYVPKLIYPATRDEFKLAEKYGTPVMFVVNRTRREGFLYDGWYVYKSSLIYCKCNTVDSVVDPNSPPE